MKKSVKYRKNEHTQSLFEHEIVMQLSAMGNPL